MTAEELQTLEIEVFNWLCRKYVQRSDQRQRDMGLQYTTAETHDLAEQIARNVEQWADCEKPLDDQRLQQLFTWAIDGALTSGYQGVAPAPAGHWLDYWWQKGRAVALREGSLAGEAGQDAPAA